MEVKMFYKTQRELAEVINQIIDGYWEDGISEENMMQQIRVLYRNNESKFVKDDNFTTILKQQCGKRRLEVVQKVLDIDIKIE
ncbi:MAG: TIGR04540 family protein [Tissierellaceae bacterium]|nr:TIGR04540 family protein [Tissierellaceae bacterium]